MNTMKWLLKREFWEHKGGFFWAPVIAGIIFLVLNLMGIMVGVATAGRSKIHIGSIQISKLIDSADPKVLEHFALGIDFMLVMTASFIMAISAFVVFFYSIGNLYDERRDRSILFWKSLPLSDGQTVLSKVISATLVAPTIGLAAGVATGLLMLLVLGLVLLFYGHNLFGIAIGVAHPIRVSLLILSAVPVAALWALPTVGWLMLCSVAARSKPFLWAVSLPVGAGVMVSWFDLMQSIALPDTWFWKHVVARMLLSVAPGSWSLYDMERFQQFTGPEEVAALLSFSEIYSTLGRADLWIGAVAGVAMLVLATRLRRWRDDA